MPIYEYRAVERGCDACRVRFEVFGKMSDPPLESCPSCGVPVRRLMSAPSESFVASMGKGNLERLGFTRYEKNKDGFYEKKFGQGPTPSIPKE